jgi:hypothetical protein
MVGRSWNGVSGERHGPPPGAEKSHWLGSIADVANEGKGVKIIKTDTVRKDSRIVKKCRFLELALSIINGEIS